MGERGWAREARSSTDSVAVRVGQSSPHEVARLALPDGGGLREMNVKLLAVTAAVGALLVGGALPAGATEAAVGPGTVVRGEWVNYSPQKTITASGSSIYLRKLDGPELDVKWRRCTGGAEGSPVRFENTDPTQRRRLGTGFLAGTVFCLSAKSYGNNDTDTWIGRLEWNVYS
jgi:hypothetical protein